MEGMTSTHPINQMKLFNVIAAAVIGGLNLVIPSAASADSYIRHNSSVCAPGYMVWGSKCVSRN